MLQIIKRGRNPSFYKASITALNRRFASQTKALHTQEHESKAVSHHEGHHDEHNDSNGEHGHHAAHGHHHVKEYDWRDDPKYNKDLYKDIRDIGWDPTEYKCPYEGREDWDLPFPPPKYNLDDVSINLRPENRRYHINAPGSMRVFS